MGSKLGKLTRLKVNAVDFGSKSISADKSNIKPVHNPNFKQPKHKVNIMFAIKSTVLKWALSALATIPEEQIWNVIEKVLSAIEQRIKNRYADSKIPNFVNVIVLLIRELLKAIHPDSQGGKRITKEEFKSLVSFLIEKNWQKEI